MALVSFASNEIFQKMRLLSLNARENIDPNKPQCDSCGEGFEPHYLFNVFDRDETHILVQIEEVYGKHNIQIGPTKLNVCGYCNWLLKEDIVNNEKEAKDVCDIMKGKS